MTRWLMALFAMILASGCGPVSSTNFETSELVLSAEIFIDGDFQETSFIIDISTSPSRSVNLDGSDQLIVHYEDQSTIATQTDDGEYRASFPFISTGEYRIELSRPRDVSAPNTTVFINNYPMLLTPVNGNSFSAGEMFELTWEARTNDGTTLTTVYGLEISAALCINNIGDNVVFFDIALTPSVNTIRDLSFPSLDGSVYSRSVDVTTVLNELEDKNDSDQAIQQCDIDVDLISETNANLSESNPNFDQQFEIIPVAIFADPILAGGGGNLSVRSNTTSITLIK